MFPFRRGRLTFHQEALFDADDETLKSRLVSKLLQDHGEYIVALGAHAITADAEVKGTPITTAELDKAVERLRTTCEAIKAEFTELYRNDAKDGPFGTWLVRLKPASVEEVQEVRVAVVGNVDAGKSTILGVLTRGGLDDGRGKARVALFKHPHEVETGRTSSIGGEILGFTTEGKPIYPSTPAIADSVKREKLAWDEIYKRAAKVVSFIDLAGHERYFKTTVFGLSGHAPDYVMLIVGGNAGLIGMSKEHLGVALALNVPIIVCVTKVSSRCGYRQLTLDRHDTTKHHGADSVDAQASTTKSWMPQDASLRRERAAGNRLCSRHDKKPGV